MVSKVCRPWQRCRRQNLPAGGGTSTILRSGRIAFFISSPSCMKSSPPLASASGKARRDAAARAIQGWYSQRLLGNGEVSDPIIKDRNSVSVQKCEKQLKSINSIKHKKPSSPYMENVVKAAGSKPSKPQLDITVIDIGPPADWVKVNVQKIDELMLISSDCTKSAAESAQRKITKFFSSLMFCHDELGVWLALKAAESLSSNNFESFSWGQSRG